MWSMWQKILNRKSVKVPLRTTRRNYLLLFDMQQIWSQANKYHGSPFEAEASRRFEKSNSMGRFTTIYENKITFAFTSYSEIGLLMVHWIWLDNFKHFLNKKHILLVWENMFRPTRVFSKIFSQKPLPADCFLFDSGRMTWLTISDWIWNLSPVLMYLLIFFSEFRVLLQKLTIHIF